jgi:hypothetical protein
MIPAAIICLFAAVFINYFRDLKDARNGHINHSRAWKWKAIASFPSGVLFALGITGWPVPIKWHSLLSIPVSALLLLCWFMFLFNAVWGIKVANDPFYRSSAVGKNLAWSEKLILHWPKWLYIFSMLGICAGSLLLYLKQLK